MFDGVCWIIDSNDTVVPDVIVVAIAEVLVVAMGGCSVKIDFISLIYFSSSILISWRRIWSCFDSSWSSALVGCAIVSAGLFGKTVGLLAAILLTTAVSAETNGCSIVVESVG